MFTPRWRLSVSWHTIYLWTHYEQRGYLHNCFELTFILLAMFMIYAVIQFILSIINLVQSIYFDSQGLLYIQGRHVLRSFVIAEVVLYLTIFTSLIALIREPEVIPFILGF